MGGQLSDNNIIAEQHIHINMSLNVKYTRSTINTYQNNGKYLTGLLIRQDDLRPYSAKCC